MNIQNTDTSYQKSLEGFHNSFYNKLKKLANESEDDFSNQKDLEVAHKVISNLKALAD